MHCKCISWHQPVFVEVQFAASSMGKHYIGPGCFQVILARRSRAVVLPQGLHATACWLCGTIHRYCLRPP